MFGTSSEQLAKRVEDFFFKDENFKNLNPLKHLRLQEDWQFV